jgi:gamma-D-glutamyl-L-lysine dipeptidyl-peptidase
VATKQKPIVSDWVICNLAVIPLYAKPMTRAMLVSQLLFGETATVVARKSKQWIKIRTQYDQVEAWVDARQLHYITEQSFHKHNNNFSCALEICLVLINNDLNFPIVLGSSLPMFDGMSFKLDNATYVYNGQAADFFNSNLKSEMLAKVAKRFVNAPLMEGGRSVFGLDKSSLVQLVLKCAGKSMPRYLAEMYAKEGEVIHFVEQAVAGDVAYFVDKNGDVNHVGIITGPNEILHLIDKVRVDSLDHEGIYQKGIRKYSHKLGIIRRYQ